MELFNDDIVYDTEVLYAFVDRKTGLFVGYDGYDTDFSKGVSAFISQEDLIKNFNQKLITKTHSEIVELLTTKSMFATEWKRLGGFDTLLIVRVDIEFNGKIFEPLTLVNKIAAGDDDDEQDETDDFING